jgi:transcriptional regulator with XRE-family HTH domain
MSYNIGQQFSSTSLEPWIALSFLPSQPLRERIGPLGLEVGTGGYETFEYVRTRGDRGYPISSCEWSRRFAEAVGITVTEKIRRIREVLGPTVTDLAALLRVSRQAVYDWQEGKTVAAENLLRLEDLANAADALALEGLRGDSRALRRPIRSGKAFLALVADGASAEKEARGLIQILRTERSQREALQKRLADRKRLPREVFKQIGRPILKEEES